MPITAIIGLASSAITAGIKKANSSIASIQGQIDERKLEQLNAKGFGTTDQYDAMLKEAGSSNMKSMLIAGGLLLIIFLMKKRR